MHGDGLSFSLKGNTLNTQIVPINRDADGVLLVTSETIAENTDRQHESILRVIDDNLADFEDFGEVRFQIGAGYNGAQVRVAHLDEPQSTLLLTYLRNNEKVRTFKKGLVKAFFQMAKQLQAPAELSRIQILQFAIAAEEKSLALESKIEADAPKLEYMELFVADGDAMSFRTAASTLLVGESKLRALLIACEWIYREDSERFSESRGRKEPQARYSEYAPYKLHFIRRQEHRAPRFRGEVMHTLKITPSGGNAISRLLGRVILEFLDLDTAIATLEQRRLERIAARKSQNTTKELF